MLDCGQAERELLARLATPARNRYYYGKLLDSYHLELEQRYGNDKRWLINRLTLGAGVLCGLDVVADANAARVRVRAGVAVDGVGREIIVPEDSPPVDPRQPTDDCGRAEGQPVRGDEVVTLYVCYHECEAEPAPVLVSECGPERMCENGLVRERYRLRVGRGAPRPPGGLTPAQCAAIFGGPPPANKSRREVVCEQVGSACDAPAETCVAIATVRFNADGRVGAIDRCSVRRTIYSNATLLDLILCLANRVDDCCGDGNPPPPPTDEKAIEIVRGDNQTGTAGQLAGRPLIVRVTRGGTPLAVEEVTFKPAPIDGEVGANPGALGPSFAVDTDTNGLGTLPSWRFGPHGGLQHVEASIDSGVPASVTFTARVERREGELPVVRAIWPPNGLLLSTRNPDPTVRGWVERMRGEPHLEVTFSHKMAPASLQESKRWLRVFVLHSVGRRTGPREFIARRVETSHAGTPGTPALGVPGTTESFALRGLEPGDLKDARWVVLMRSEGGAIVGASSHALELDAEYRGTKLSAERRDELWSIEERSTIDQTTWDEVTDSGAKLAAAGATTPHSGDGAEGGRFDSFFTVLGVA